MDSTTQCVMFSVKLGKYLDSVGALLANNKSTIYFKKLLR